MRAVAVAGLGITAVNTIGVLTQIDRLGEGSGDPWATARRQAAKDRKRLGAMVSTILPALTALRSELDAVRGHHRLRQLDLARRSCAPC